MQVFLLPEASISGEQLTGKWPLWEDLIHGPAAFQHALWSLQAVFLPYYLYYFVKQTFSFLKERVKTSKHDKKYYPKWAWSFLFSHVIVYRQWSLYSGEFFHPSEHRCQWYPESPPDAGCQTGRAVVTWCLTAGLDSRRAASWHALCSTFSGTWSSEKKRGDLCEIRKEGRSKQTRKKIPQRKRQQNARHKVGNSHAEQ